MDVKKTGKHEKIVLRNSGSSFFDAMVFEIKMATSFSDTVLLDPSRFQKETRKWNVPILLVPGVEVVELNIGGTIVSTGEYSVQGNYLSLSNNVAIDSRTKAFLIVRYSTKSLLVTFWLPIILAIFGFLGAAIQPILYKVDLIYQPSLTIQPKIWSYDTDTKRFSITLSAESLRSADTKEWKIYVGVRERDDSLAPSKATYDFYSGPIDLDSHMKIDIRTNDAFNAHVLQRRAQVQGVVFKVKKGISIKDKFVPGNFLETDVVLVAHPSVQATPN